MSERERVRRPEPARTEPVRNVSGVFRSGDPNARASGNGAHGNGAHAGGNGHGGASAAGSPSSTNPFAWPGDDPVSRAVRAGCDVVEQAVRRGFGVGRDGNGGPWSAAGPWSMGSWAGPWSGALNGQWSTGQWIDAMTSAFAQWAQWMDGWSSMARSGMPGAMAAANEPGTWPPPPRAAATTPATTPATTTASPLCVQLDLRSPRAVCVQLDLTTAATDLSVHGLLAPPAAAAPPITDVALTVADGAVTISLGSIDQHPAATYVGAVLAGGRACGTLTITLQR
jgi:hypothetical protein